jgi:hypothetical protein
MEFDLYLFFVVSLSPQNMFFVMQILQMASLGSIAIYATCGGILICCLETQGKFARVIIAVNFGFLFDSVWRFIFYLMLGSVTWSYKTLPGKIVAIAFAGVACFNTYVLCRYPAYRKLREKFAEEEDRRIEARISEQVKKQAARQMLGRSKNRKVLKKKRD